MSKCEKAITAAAEKRETLAKIHANLGGDRNLEEWVEKSPLVEVLLQGEA